MLSEQNQYESVTATVYNNGDILWSCRTKGGELKRETSYVDAKGMSTEQVKSLTRSHFGLSSSCPIEVHL